MYTLTKLETYYHHYVTHARGLIVYFHLNLISLILRIVYSERFFPSLPPAGIIST